jgi:anthranilate phosphoribosyltransferase
MTSDEDIAGLVRRLGARQSLSAEESTRLFTAVMEGAVSPIRMSAILTAMAVRGPGVEEIIGGARALRAHAVTVAAPANAIDLCGTGGDHHGTLNVSTAVSLVVAACGVPVAKHGNRAMSSRTGAADVLESLGVVLTVKPEGAERCLREAGMCFLFAQAHHPAMRHVAPVRKELGFRTLFNILGPLSNPAGVKRQLLGVFDRQWLEPLARTLQALGAEKAWIVHGSDGLDEITLSGPTLVCALENGGIRSFEIAPEDAGLDRAPLSAVKGGSPEENAAAITALLSGARGAFRDIVLLNAAAALIVADKCNTLRDGVGLAATALDSGAAARTLQKLVSVSREVAA